MGDKFRGRIIETMESFEGKGWVSQIIGNFSEEEKLYVTNPQGWRRDEEYCKMENYVNGSQNRKDAIIFYKLCKAGYKYFPDIWSGSIVEE